jgi:type IV secretory pathway VirB4 component
MPAPPLGVKKDRSVFWFDPFWAHEQDVDLVNAPVYLVTGNRGRGKSTLQKVIIMRIGARRGRLLEGGEHAPMRIRINDRKLEKQEPEYAAVVRHLGGRIERLNRQAGINIFDPEMGMEEDDIVATTINIVEMVSGVSPLPRHQKLALRVGVWKMLRDRKDEISPAVLEAKLMALTVQDLDGFFSAKNDHYEGNRIPAHLFEEDSTETASHIGEVLGGVYGGMFGGKTSLRDVLSDYVVLLDWTGVSDEARTLLSSMLWKWQEIAQRNGDEDLIPDMLFTDEEHQALRNLMYVRFMSASLKEARALRTAYFISSQHETDLTMAGDPESEIRNLSESIGLSIGGRFIFQQPENKRVLDIYRGLGFSELDVLSLPQLRRGSYFFHAPSHPPIPVHLVLTPIEAELSGTESAIKSMTKE